MTFHFQRYIQDPNTNTIKLSLHIMPDSITCELDASYNSVEAGKYVQFILSGGQTKIPNISVSMFGNC